ncbi:hypothetical protein ACJRO7_022537 [Eucalyptus globulus]|uniref:ABC1 atypical kinase-like domain-containing protein n=1 Tax=Eucalyptus globulus TaxID=34317 RepID=A0ABD3K3T7_EUCGL
MARAANATVYSSELLSRRYGSCPIKAIGRTLEILVSLGSFAIKLLLDQRNGQIDKNKRKRGAELRRIFTRLGPTFVKIGQGLSTRPNLYPPKYLEELSRYSFISEHDALPTFPHTEAFVCMEKELGLTLDLIFSSISPSLIAPIAAASLGQVYKVRLRYSNQLVVVKVQGPGIEEAIGLDFYLIRGLRIHINKYVNIITSDVVALIDEFAQRNARRFKKLYADKTNDLVPDIFWDYTSGKVLTMEWVDGIKLNEQEAIERQGLKVLDLVNAGIQCSLRQLLEYGYFHADSHLGNLLATLDGKLAFLDFGMTSETPEDARLAIIGHMVHLVNRDYEAMACDYYALDFLAPNVDVAPNVPALRNFLMMQTMMLYASMPAFSKTYEEKATIKRLITELANYPWNDEIIWSGYLMPDFEKVPALMNTLPPEWQAVLDRLWEVNVVLDYRRLAVSFRVGPPKGSANGLLSLGLTRALPSPYQFAT